MCYRYWSGHFLARSNQAGRVQLGKLSSPGYSISTLRIWIKRQTSKSNDHSEFKDLLFGQTWRGEEWIRKLHRGCSKCGKRQAPPLQTSSENFCWKDRWRQLGLLASKPSWMQVKSYTHHLPNSAASSPFLKAVLYCFSAPNRILKWSYMTPSSGKAIFASSWKASKHAQKMQKWFS